MSKREHDFPVRWLLTQILKKSVKVSPSGAKIFEEEIDLEELRTVTLDKSLQFTGINPLQLPLKKNLSTAPYKFSISVICEGKKVIFKSILCPSILSEGTESFSTKSKLNPGETALVCFAATLLSFVESRMVSNSFCESTYDQLCNELTENTLDSTTQRPHHLKSGRVHRKVKKSNSLKQTNSKVDRGPPISVDHIPHVNIKSSVNLQDSSLRNEEEIEDDRDRLNHTKAPSEGSDTGYSSRCSTPPSAITFGDVTSDLPLENDLKELISSQGCEKKPRSRSPSPSTGNSSSTSSGSSSDGETKDQRLDSQNGYLNKYCYRKSNYVQNLGYKVNSGARQSRKSYREDYNDPMHGHSNYYSKYEKRSNYVIYRGGGGSHFTYQSYRDNSEKNNLNYSKKNLSDLYYQYVSQADVRESWGPYKRRLTSSAGKFSALKIPKANDWKIPLFKDIHKHPDNLLNNSDWDDLSIQIWDMFVKNQQEFTTFKAKIQLKDRIADVIHNILPTSHLFVVGSSLSGFGSNSSDVDMCLMVTERRLDQRNDAQHILKLLQRELNNCGYVENMTLICAKVPIIRFRDSQTGFEVDLNCNNSVGIRNTHLLNAYSQLDWRVRPLVLVVKLWARQNEIDNARKQTISSYSLVLMVIHYLQSGVTPSLLPCLHKSFPDKFNPFNYIFTMPATEKLPEFTSKNEQTLGELFVGFMDYYANVFRYHQHAISVRNGTTMSVFTCMYNDTCWNDPRMWNFLCIEEPFDLTNTASAVYDHTVFSGVKSVFQKSYECLSKEKNLSLVCPVNLQE